MDQIHLKCQEPGSTNESTGICCWLHSPPADAERCLVSRPGTLSKSTFLILQLVKSQLKSAAIRKQLPASLSLSCQLLTADCNPGAIVFWNASLPAVDGCSLVAMT